MSPPNVRLGDVLELTRRPIEAEPDAEYQMLGIYSHAKGTFRKEPILGANAPQVGLYRVRAGDFVLNITFAWEGAIAIIGDQDDGWTVSGRFPTFCPDPERLDLWYLFYYFRTRRGRDQLVAVSPGSAGRNRVLSIRRFLDLTVPLPSLDDQRGVACRVQAVARAVDKAHQVRDAADKEAKVLAAEHARAIVLAGAAGSRPLQELVAIRGGGTPSKSNPLFWSGEIPWISPKDMKAREIYDSIDHITTEATSESPAKLLEPGCVLIVTRGMILAHTVPAATLRVPAAINQDMKALIPGDEITADYLCAVLRALNADLVSLVERSTHDTRKLRTDSLLAFEIPVRTSEEQSKLVARLAASAALHGNLRALGEEVRLGLTALVPATVNQEFA